MTRVEFTGERGSIGHQFIADESGILDGKVNLLEFYNTHFASWLCVSIEATLDQNATVA